MEALLSVVALGFVLGLQHATDPDHLVAVATIVTRERRFRDGARIGVLWGLGHMTTLVVAGGVIFALHLTVGPRTRVGLELLVALMLVLLGAVRLRDAVRGLGSVSTAHLSAHHEHGHAEALHSHPHAHGDHVHRHPHLHPSRALAGALGRGRFLGGRALLIGAVHGMAGSAALSLLVLATLGSVWSAVAYLLVFGLGTIAGMTAFTAALAYPVSLALRFQRMQRALAFGASVGSIAFGLFYALRMI